MLWKQREGALKSALGAATEGATQEESLDLTPEKPGVSEQSRWGWGNF